MDKDIENKVRNCTDYIESSQVPIKDNLSSYGHRYQNQCRKSMLTFFLDKHADVLYPS